MSPKDTARTRLSFQERWRMPSYLNRDEITTGKVSFNPDTCDRCGICAAHCPLGSIVVPKGKANGGRAPHVAECGPDMYLCFACGQCVSACPTNSVTLERRYTAHFYYNRLWKAPELAPPKAY
jgi:formate hydrogenlyase subunit 6/NADH:ubiquinone oxidoreductase subunit I